MHKLRRLIATLSVAAILSTLIVSTASAGVYFDDVPDDEWYASYVNDLVDMGVVDGSKDYYRPGDNLNRAEAVKLLVEAFDLQGMTDIDFSDVDLGDWYYDHLETAVANGLVQGYDDGTFRGTNYINRAEWAKVVTVAAGLPECSADNPFSDVPAGEWYEMYATTAYCYQVIDGFDDGTFRGGNNTTRAEAAKMISQAMNPELRPSLVDDVVDDIVDDVVDDIVDAGGLNVSVEEPENFADVVPIAADYVPVMDLVFEANDGPVEVDELVVTRGGLSSNSDVDVLSLFVEGEQYGNNVSVNSDNTATFNLSNTPIMVPDGGSATATVTLSPSATAATGDIFQFSVEGEDHVGSDASSTTGSFPLESGEMTASATAIGTYTITNGPDNPTANYNPESGDTDVRLLQWKITPATENQTLQSFTLTENGTAAASDYEALKVYNDTTGELLCETETWNASGKFTCIPEETITIDKGESNNFSLKVDVKSGSGTTMSAKIKDGGAYGVQLIGDDYGFITGTASAWAGTGTAQTIAAGALVVTLHPDTPATGNVAAGADDEVLVRYQVEAKGEDITVTEWSNTAILGTAVSTELTNCTLSLEDGEGGLDRKAGPVDATAVAAADATHDDYIRFTDTFQIPVGMNTVSLACDLGSTMTTGDTIQIGFDDSNVEEDAGGNAPDVAITAKGFTTNDTVTPTPADADVLGRVQSVKSGAVSAITMTTPPADTIIPGMTGVHLADLQIDATSSGEDVKISTILVTNTPAGGASASDMSNIGIYTSYLEEADCTGTNRFWSESLGLCRLDSINQATTTAVNTAETETYNLETPLEVKKGEAAIVKVYGDYKAGVGGAGETHTFDWAATNCAVGTGASTGATVQDAACNTGAGQTMTYAANGILATTWGSNPTANDNAVAGTSMVHYGDYKLVAANEDVILDTAMFTRISDIAGGTDDAGNFGEMHLYRVDGSEETALQSSYLTDDPGAPGTDVVIFDLESLDTEDRTIGKDETVKLRLYGDVKTISGGADSGSADSFDIAAGADLAGTGAGSGAAVTANAAVTIGKYKVVRKSLPTYAPSTAGLSTNLGNGTSRLYQFTVTADSAGDVSLKKVTFDLTMNDNDGGGELVLSNAKIYNAADSSNAIQVLNETAAANVYTCGAGDADNAFNDYATTIICAFTAEETIAAGSTNTYFLEATVAGSETSDFITTRLADESTTLGANTNLEYLDDEATGAIVELDTAFAKAGTETAADHIWSDFSAGAGHTEAFGAVDDGDNDWTGGYLLDVIPSTDFTISKS